MRQLLKLSFVELKIFVREPVAAFFTLVLPPMLLLVIGSIYGNAPQSIFGNLGTMDVAVPSYGAVVIATSGLVSLVIMIASYREKGILRRLRATTLRPYMIVGALVIVLLLANVVGMALLILTGHFAFGLQFRGNPFSVLGAFTLGSLSVFSLGFVLSGVLVTARTAQVVGLALYYPMIFLSGAALPGELLPARLQQISYFLPLTYVVTLLRGTWAGDAWGTHAVDAGVLVMLLVLGAAVAAKTFRWE